MYEKEILIKRLTKTLKRKRPNKCGRQKPDKLENINLDKLYHIETRNRFAKLQNTQDEVFAKEAKNYKEKETLQHHHQTSVYSKQNHRSPS